MTLSIIDSGRLARLSGAPTSPPVASITTSPHGAAYLTEVYSVINGIRFCLYAETHRGATAPKAVINAIEAFNASPTVWRSLVEAALDVDEQVLTEDREALTERAAHLATIRARLLA
ncbi:hypothetical protein [Microbacterium sp. 77mftsu3.1]|uniref:hypothetical protein n=1 Tax=Microbacterium sp. 77mftsu3.1 TaxID=1761802 RepID=UPI00036D98E5|nr:hypothetical protein [Microbacterium sp. 77mftsu3.1]SDH41577.1 hypothetical protein SAMN04488590_3284 [Microbacterium sp. 77mftsu3.1]